jgi:2,4-dienoyl-CoA reductase-like NADH-dependent reductase (Old Yellow Enzyme family)
MGMEFGKPHAATEEEIAGIIDGFAHAAEYLDKAGFDGIELHSAHGYLLAQFLSKTTNKRTDKYGGSLENRARLITEIAAEIRKRVSSSFIVGIKINSVEFQEGGFSPEEAKGLCQVLEASKFDFVELSGGTYQSLAFSHKRESTKKREAFFLEFAEEVVKPLTKTKTYVTGGFKTVGGMVKALETVDGVGLGRPLCQEPRFCKEVLEGKITGAIKMGFADDDFGSSIAAAGTQIKQIGKDEEPIDLSKKENIEAFYKDLEAWAAARGADKERKQYGFMDLSQKAQPYGAASVPV